MNCTGLSGTKKLVIVGTRQGSALLNCTLDRTWENFDIDNFVINVTVTDPNKATVGGSLLNGMQKIVNSLNSTNNGSSTN